MEITHEEFLKALKIVNDYHIQFNKKLNVLNKQIEDLPKSVNYNKDTPLHSCSVKIWNIIKSGDIGDRVRDQYGYRGEITLKDLEGYSKTEFINRHQVGKKTLDKLIEICHYAGVNLID